MSNNFDMSSLSGYAASFANNYAAAIDAGATPGQASAQATSAATGTYGGSGGYYGDGGYGSVGANSGVTSLSTPQDWQNTYGNALFYSPDGYPTAVNLSVPGWQSAWTALWGPGNQIVTDSTNPSNIGQTVNKLGWGNDNPLVWSQQAAGGVLWNNQMTPVTVNPQVQAQALAAINRVNEDNGKAQEAVAEKAWQNTVQSYKQRGIPVPDYFNVLRDKSYSLDKLTPQSYQDALSGKSMDAPVMNGNWQSPSTPVASGTNNQGTTTVSTASPRNSTPVIPTNFELSNTTAPDISTVSAMNAISNASSGNGATGIGSLSNENQEQKLLTSYLGNKGFNATYDPGTNLVTINGMQFSPDKIPGATLINGHNVVTDEKALMNAIGEYGSINDDQWQSLLQQLIDSSNNPNTIPTASPNATLNYAGITVPTTKQLTYDEAVKQASNQWDPYYDTQMNKAMSNIKKDLVTRGFFGQLPEAAIEAGQATEINNAKAQQVAATANQLKSASDQLAMQTYQLQLQLANAKTEAEQNDIQNQITANQNKIANIISIMGAIESGKKLDLSEEELAWNKKQDEIANAQKDRELSIDEMYKMGLLASKGSSSGGSSGNRSSGSGSNSSSSSSSAGISAGIRESIIGNMLNIQQAMVNDKRADDTKPEYRTYNYYSEIEKAVANGTWDLMTVADQNKVRAKALAIQQGKTDPDIED